MRDRDELPDHADPGELALALLAAVQGGHPCVRSAIRQVRRQWIIRTWRSREQSNRWR